MFIKKKLNGIAYYSFVCLCIIATGSTLAGYFGEYNLYLEFASGYKLQFLLMAWCSLVYFLFTRRKFWIIVSLFCILINFGEILPWYFNRPKITNIEQHQPLKVLSYNVFWKNEDYDRAIALVRQQQPDIAVFQEALHHWNRGLAPLKSDFPYHVRAEKLEIEIYSKLPLLNPEIKLYGTYRGLVIADIEVGDRLVKFVGTHAYPQLYWGKGGWQIRNRHLKYGIGEYAPNVQQPLVIIGDLNVSMWSPFYHSMIERSGLHNARQGFGILPTHSIIAPQFASLSAPIDHCLVSPDIQVKNFTLGEAIGSDHLPIIAELLIPQSSD